MENGWVTSKTITVEEKQGADFEIKPWGNFNYWSKYPRSNVVSGILDENSASIAFVLTSKLYRQMTMFRCNPTPQSNDL